MSRPEAANSGYAIGTHALRSLPDDVAVPAYYSTVPLLTALNPRGFARVEPLLVLQLHHYTRTRLQV